MINAVIIAHRGLADGLLRAAEMIMGRLEGIFTVSIDPDDGPETLKAKIGMAVEKAMPENNGIVLLTDLFGGTPTNIGMSFLEEGKVELVTGVNLPMLIKYISHRDKDDLETLGKRLRDEGQRSIYLASEMLSGTVEL